MVTQYRAAPTVKPPKMLLGKGIDLRGENCYIFKQMLIAGESLLKYLFFAAIIFLLLGFSPLYLWAIDLNPSEMSKDILRFDKGYKQVINGIPIIYLKGTPYEMGQQNAYLNKPIFIKGMQFFMGSRKYILRDVPWYKSWPMLWLSNWRMKSIFSRYDAGIQQEIQGVIDGLKGEIPKQDIIQASTVFDLVMNYACTTFAAQGEATANKQLIIGRNFDFGGAGYFDIPFITIYEPDSGYRFASIGVPVWNLSGVTSFNEKGLVVIAHIALTKDANLKEKPIGELIRKIIQHCATIEEALALLKTTPRMCGINLTLAEGLSQKVAVVEISAHDFEVRWPEKDVLWTTNHYVSPKMKEKTASSPYLLNFQLRYARMQQLLENNYGKIDIAKVVEFLRDRYALNRGKEVVNTHNICPTFRTEYPFSPNNDLSVVFEPGSFNFWLSKGGEPAALGEFVGFNLLSLFEGKDSEVTPAAIPASSVPSQHQYKKLLANYQTFYNAQESYKKENYVNAIIDLKKVIEIEPDHIEAYYLLAYIYFRNEKWETAKDYANKVIQLEEQLPILPQFRSQTALSYVLLGRIFREEDKVQEAEQSFNKAIELAEKWPQANNEYAAKLANKYLKAKKFLGLF